MPDYRLGMGGGQFRTQPVIGAGQERAMPTTVPAVPPVRPHFERLVREVGQGGPSAPKLRPDLGPGAFEIEGKIYNKPHLIEKLLGAFNVGAIGGRYGPGAAEQFRRQTFYRPYEEKLAEVEREMAARTGRLKELVPLAEIEERMAGRQEAAGRPIPIAGGYWNPATGEFARTELPEDFTLGPGQQRRTHAGAVLAEVPPLAKEPPIPMPGRDVPFPPAVEEQRKRMQGGLGRGTTEDVKDIAQAIMQGDQPPELTRLYGLSGPIQAELSRKGFPLAAAQRDWRAIQRYLSTRNSPPQIRLLQATEFAFHSLDIIEERLEDWKKTGLPGGFRIWNRLALQAAKQLPGEAGAKAQALDAQINDLVAELAQVYRGGNAPTDEAMQLAAQNLGASWNEEQLKKQLQVLRQALRIRLNSVKNVGPQAVSTGSPYLPPGGVESIGAAGEQERITATNPDTGERVVSDDGGVTWQPPQ